MTHASSFRADAVHPGDLVAGKYRVRTILGRRHGLLVEAFHTEFDQRVVVKLLPPSAADAQAVERFRREARTLAKLESEHVARIVDVGSQPDGTFYLVRQYLEGVDLAAHLLHTGAQPLDQAVLFILQAAEAVAETHGHGIILRELSPSHLFLTQRPGGAPLVKLIDFGTAKLMRDATAPMAEASLTATAMFGLSPYSSPELVPKAKSVDVRTDVWSLGAVFYELATGTPPFAGDMARLMLQITRDDPALPSHLVPGLPVELDRVIAWAMARDLDGRFGDVRAFAHALAPWAPPEGQVLIERIGQIAAAAKLRKRTGSVPPPAPSSSGQPADAGGMGPLPPPRPPPSFASQPPPPRASEPPPGWPSPIEQQETTVVIDGALPPSFGSAPGGALDFDNAAADAAVPAPPVSAPASFPPPRSAPPEAALASTSQPAPNSSAHPPPMGSMPPASVHPAQAAVGEPFDKRIALAVLVAVASVLTVLFVVLLARPRPQAAIGNESTSATAAPPPPSAVAVAPPPTASEATPVSTPSPVATASPPPAETVAATKIDDLPPADPPAETAVPRGARRADPPRKEPPPRQPPPPKEPPPAKEPPAASGGSGTLVAVAVGGSCAFAVNGASKGNGSTLKLTLAPGTYSVSCKPATGASKSRSVTVKSGETAMASFKL